MGDRLLGKRAVVTGAGRGIGRAIAERFLAEGASVLVNDVDPDRLAAAAREMSSLGEVASYAADVSDPVAVEAMFAHAEAALGGIDVLAANAGIAHARAFLALTADEWDRTLAVNLRGVFLCGQAAARRMVAQGTGGAIVNMSSTNGLMGERDLAAYNASKAGVILLTKTMAIELAPYGIRANCVNPGWIATELSVETGLDPGFVAAYMAKIPLRRYGRPDDVAAAFAYLASDDASFVTGTELVVDGGQLAEE